MELLQFINLLGVIGGIMGVLLYIPQIVKTLKSKSAKDLSYWTYLIILANDILWTFWGLGTNNAVVWVPNGIAIGLSTFILVLKSRYG